MGESCYRILQYKRRAPTCHTVCELVLARWGPAAHKTFIYFSLLTSIIVTSMLLLGGSATINALAGCDLKLTSFLIPWGVIVYTMAGGLKATFLASYVHTAIVATRRLESYAAASIASVVSPKSVWWFPDARAGAWCSSDFRDSVRIAYIPPVTRPCVPSRPAGSRE